MRVKVTGGMDSAATLRGYLIKSGTVAVVETEPDYVIALENGPQMYFDSVDCPLEACLFRHVRDLAQAHIEMRTKGGIQTDNAVRIVFPDAERRAVELGVVRGFADFVAAPSSGGAPAHEAPALPRLEAMYERMLADRDSQIFDLRQRLSRAVQPWWKRLFLRG